MRSKGNLRTQGKRLSFSQLADDGHRAGAYSEYIGTPGFSEIIVNRDRQRTCKRATEAH